MSKTKTASWLKLIIGAIILLIIPKFVPNSYIMTIVINIMIYVILAMGLNLLTGFTGILSLGHAAFFGVGAYTAAILNTRFHFQFPITVLAAILVTLAMSMLLAVPALKVKGSYLVLMTIGFGEVVRLILQNWRSLTGGPNGIVGISSPNFYLFKLTNAYQYYYLILFFIVILQLYIRVLMKSRVGRCLLAIRDDDRAAEMVGIDIAQYKIKAFGISAIYCAIAGTLYAHTIQFVDPNSFRGDESQLILCCVIIGGIGTYAGPIVGAILLQTIPELFRGLMSYRLVIYGVILMITIIFFPGGIAKYAGLGLQKLKSLFGGGSKNGPPNAAKEGR